MARLSSLVYGTLYVTSCQSILEQGISFLAGSSERLTLFVCVRVCVSCAEVSSVPGQSSSFSSETGAAHPDGPPSQPHALHRSQVTNGNRLQLRVTDAVALISFCFHLMPQIPSAVTL